MNSIRPRHFGELFEDDRGNARVIHGVSILTNSTRLAELAGRIGYQTVWIEVEHGTASFTEVESLCVAAEAGGAAPTVRIPDSGRDNVLRALEAGARIVMVPMVNTAADAEAIVHHGKFPPLGGRGFNTRSRGVSFGLTSPLQAFQRANEQTYLFAQIETLRGIENLDEICRVDGLAGILVGPGDLSQDMGKTAQFTDPELMNVIKTCIRRARSLGKHAGILTASKALLDLAMDAGCDLVFAGGDIQDLAEAWSTRLETLAKHA